MPEKGFTAITVKEEFADHIRACYKALAEAAGYPVILDKEAYKVIEDLIAKRRARDYERAVNAIVKAHGGKGGIYLSIHADVELLCNKFLTMESERNRIETIPDLIIYALYTFLYQKITRSHESIWQIDNQLYLIGDFYRPDSIETWVPLVKRMISQGARARIVEWRHTETIPEGGYTVYLGCETNNKWFIVGGMNDFSGSGKAAYRTARDFFEQIRQKPELRDSRDPLFRDFLDKHDKFLSQQPERRLPKLLTLADFKKSPS